RPESPRLDPRRSRSRGAGAPLGRRRRRRAQHRFRAPRGRGRARPGPQRARGRRAQPGPRSRLPAAGEDALMRLKHLLVRAAPLALAWVLAATARAAEEHGEHAAASPLLIVYHALGLAVLIGVLVYFARTPVQTFLRDRSDTLRRQLETAKLA